MVEASPLVFAIFSGSRDFPGNMSKNWGWRLEGWREQSRGDYLIRVYVKYNCMSTMEITWALNLTKYT